MRSLRNLALLSVSILSISAPAFAQSSNQPAAEPEAAPSADIVVTGTLIRGSSAVGSQTIGVDQSKIASIGAANTSDLIASIPQAGNFLSYVGVRGSSNFSLAVNRPSLRQLGNTSSSTASTLLLLDGHRMPGMGILQTSPDLDAIAPMAIERVEIVPDGGSSIYGSDAVGGVINFITRKRFDGVEAKASYGFGDDYRQVNAGVIVGKTWSTGSAYVTYDYSWHDEIYGYDRAWWQSLNWPATQAAGVPLGSSTNCSPGNVTVGATTVPLPGFAGSPNRCDITKTGTIYPRESKHSVLASLTFDPGGPVSASLKGFYLNRVSQSNSDQSPYALSLAVRSNSPFYNVGGLTERACSAPNASLNCETVAVNFASILGTNIPQVTKLESFGFTPSVKIDMGSKWQLNVLANYGHSKSSFIGNLFNASPIAGATAPSNSSGVSTGPGTFNPFNLGAAGNAATIATARDWFQYGRATNEMINARIVADGPIAHLPGGDLRVAVGAEYIYESYSGVTTRGATAATIAGLSNVDVTRQVASVFGEINLPIIGEDNRGFLYGLSLTASGRYDHYSDFGGTFNPKFGVNIEPTDWLKLRGNWGKAFQAPGLSDLAQIGLPSISPLLITQRPFLDPTIPATAPHNQYILTVGGTIPGLQPQKATTWSLGFDMKVPPIPGLELGLTYYNIDFRGQISVAPIFQPTFYALYPDKAVVYTAAGGNQAMSDFFDKLTQNASPAAKAAALATVGSFDNVYSVLDGRTANLGRVKTSGVDFYTRYRHETGFGDIYASVDGTYILTYEQGGTGPFLLNVNGFDTVNQLKLNTTVGTDIGNLKAQVTWAHTNGVTEIPSVANLQQGHVDGMDVINLFFQYKVPSESYALKDLSLSLNIDNLFNVDPPFYRGLSNSLNGAANGFTLGRVVKFSIAKRF